MFIRIFDYIIMYALIGGAIVIGMHKDQISSDRFILSLVVLLIFATLLISMIRNSAEIFNLWKDKSQNN